jgi:hypothetical protein
MKLAFSNEMRVFSGKDRLNAVCKAEKKFKTVNKFVKFNRRL